MQHARNEMTLHPHRNHLYPHHFLETLWRIKSRLLRAPQQKRSCSLLAWKRRLHLPNQRSQQRRPLLMLQRLHPRPLPLNLLLPLCPLRRHFQQHQSLLRSPSLLPHLKPQLPLPVSLQSQRQP